MARIDLIRSLYSKDISIDQFNFDNLKAYPLLYYLDPYVIHELNKISKSVKLQGNPKKKYKLMEELLNPYGFRRISSGTNRAIFKHLDDQRIILKVALDAVGLNDNPAEFHNQNFLKPFVTKCFSVSPCGTVGIFERVQPIMRKSEFLSVAGDIFALINKMIGKYILEDIGTKFYMNYGLREGFGPVLLDFPYMYELDGKKLHCGNKNPYTGEVCNGIIDYDEGFNQIYCTKCGKVYLATELQKNMEDNNIIIENSPSTKGVHKMKFEIVRQSYDENGNVISEQKVSENKVLPETSHIVSKEEFNRTLNVEVERKRKPNILYNQRPITPSKQNLEIRTPKIGVSVVRPTRENKNLPETKQNNNREEPQVVQVPKKLKYEGNISDVIRDAQQRCATRNNPGIIEANLFQRERNQSSIPVESEEVVIPTETEIVDKGETNNEIIVDVPSKTEDVSESILDQY